MTGNSSGAVALTALIAAEHPRLVAWLYKKTGDWHLSEDIASNTYLYLWQHTPEVNIALLYHSAKQRLIDHRCKHKHEMVCIEEAGHIPCQRDEIEQFIIRDEIERHMSQMTKSEREVTELVAQGMSFSEISRELCIPVGTVKSRTGAYRQRKGIVNKPRAVNIRTAAKRHLREHGRITAAKLAKVAKCSDQLANYHLTQMEKRGIIVMVGVETTLTMSAKGGSMRWVYALAPRILKMLRAG